MKVPSQKQVNVYVNVEHGGKCPFCGSEQIAGGSVTIDSGCAGQKVWCNDCGAEWHDEYELVGVSVCEEGNVDTVYAKRGD